jgi:hypothetical protein
MKEAFLNSFQAHGRNGGKSYIETIKSLPGDAAKLGTDWLQQIIVEVCQQATTLLPALKLFRK